MSEKVTEERKSPRYEYLDILRGITLISMIAYHAMWDVVYIAGVNIAWYRSTGAYIWQQSICWTFILLAGFCWSLGRKRVKRGLLVFLGGALISLVTCVLMPNQRVMFGVLTFLGSSMLILIPLEKLLHKVPAWVGAIVSFLLFLVMKNINHGSLGFGSVRVVELPEALYDCGDVMTFLGFLDKDFYSTDYFGLLPWFFLFVTGYFLYRVMRDRELLEHPVLLKIKNPPLSFIGRHSLLLYMLHQPIIYVVVIWLF